MYFSLRGVPPLDPAINENKIIMKIKIASFFIAVLLTSVNAVFPTWDVVLFGSLGNLAEKYLWQSLLHLSAETRGGLNVIAVGRGEVSTLKARVKAVISSNTSCGSQPSKRCQDFRVRFAASVTSATSDDLEALGDMLCSSPTRHPKWQGRLLYFAIPSEAVPAILRTLTLRCDLSSLTRVVVEKPVGRDQASAIEILGSIQRGKGMPSQGDILLMDHWLGKAGVQVIAGVRWALSKGATPPTPSPWHSLLDSPLLTEAWAMETEDCKGRGGYYNTAGALRDMVVTHLTLAASAALQPPLSASKLTPATRAGVLSSLTIPFESSLSTTSQGLAFASYNGALLKHNISTATSAAAALLKSNRAQGKDTDPGRVVIWSGKALGIKSGGVRQLLSLAPRLTSYGSKSHFIGAVGEAAAHAQCGPLTITWHIQGDLLSPHPSLQEQVASLRLPLTHSSPALLITGLCGAVGKALGDPYHYLSQLEDRTIGGWRWEVRRDIEEGLWGAVLVSLPRTIDAAILSWGDDWEGNDANVPDGAKVLESLKAAASRLGLSGGDAYTSSIAAALLGGDQSSAVGERFLSSEETERLWVLWGGAAEIGDEAAANRTQLLVNPHEHGTFPDWMKHLEIGATLPFGVSTSGGHQFIDKYDL